MASGKWVRTVWELVIVVGLIGFLISLLLPATESAREAARRAQCNNNLKQIGLAALNYESAIKCYPTSGWGCNWIGDPDRGTAPKQPGGLFYNIMPYLECSTIYNHQSGKAYGSDGRLEAVKQICETANFSFTCPSRRQAKTYPFTHKPQANDGTASFYTSGLFCDAAGESLLSVAKTDYAGNGGQHFFTADTLPGDKMCDAGGPVGAAVPPAADPYVLFDTAMKEHKPIQDGADRWKLTPNEGIAKFAAAADGIFYPFSQVKTSDISDGTEHTYLCGEKALSSDHYEDGLDDGDDQCVWMGHDKDIVRWVENEVTGQIAAPLRDGLSQKTPPGANSLFGSVHAGGCNMAFCDGSVRQIAYTIDPTVHARLANRRDGQEIDLSKLSF